MKKKMGKLASVTGRAEYRMCPMYREAAVEVG